MNDQTELTELLFPDADTFEAMVLLAAGGIPDSGLQDRLDALGVADGILDGGLRDVLAPILAPVCQFRLLVSDPEAQFLHQGWVDGEVTAILTQGDEDECVLRWTTTPFATAALANLVGLGPRRARFEGRVPLTEPDDLWSEHPRVRQVAATMAAEHAGTGSPLHAALTDGVWTAWHLEFAWPYVDESLAMRKLEVLDTPEVMSRVDEGDLVCTSPTEVWRRMQRLLPGDAELAPALAGHRDPDGNSA